MYPNKIREFLLNNGVTLSKLADKMGLSPQNLNNVFSAKDIKLGKLIEISKHSNISLKVLLEESIDFTNLKQNIITDSEMYNLLNELENSSKDGTIDETITKLKKRYNEN